MALASLFVRALAILPILLIGPVLTAQQHDVLASRYDDGRTGAALTETLLTPDAIDMNVSPTSSAGCFLTVSPSKVSPWETSMLSLCTFPT